MPLLLVVVLVKYFMLVCNKFRTSKRLFYINVSCYVVFLIVIAIIDYRVELFGN